MTDILRFTQQTCAAPLNCLLAAKAAGVKGAARHGLGRLPLTPDAVPLRSQNGGRLWAALAGVVR